MSFLIVRYLIIIPWRQPDFRRFSDVEAQALAPIPVINCRSWSSGSRNPQLINGAARATRGALDQGRSTAGGAPDMIGACASTSAATTPASS